MEKVFNNSKKFFSLFLIINAILWVCVESFRNLISKDAMEAVVWGNLLSLGTNKHPPLSGWFAGAFYGIFGENDIGIYILGQVCIIAGLIFIYKLAKDFLDEEKAICASLIMTPCMFYTYQAFYDNYNCNYLSIALWAMMGYFFHKSLKTEKLSDWSIFGLLAGLGVLAKYQAAFLFFGMFLYMIFYERKSFGKFGVYLAAIIASVIVSPHVYWLFQNDFFSFVYLIGRTESAVEGGTISLIQRFSFPLKFFLDQLLALAPCFALYLILFLKEKNIKVNFDIKNKNTGFLLLLGILPLIIIASMGIFTTSRIVGAWGSMMVGFIGIILFYFFPINLNENSYKFFKKWIITLATLWLIGMLLFALLQKKLDMGYPHQTVMPEINKIWADNTANSPLKYVKGEDKYTFHFRLYNNQKPTVILNTYGAKNPWIIEEDVKANGVLVVGFDENDVKSHIEALGAIVPEKFNKTPEKFEYQMKNVLNKTKNGEFYYVIIPPQKVQGDK